MNSKERVKRAIHFNRPDRVPVHLPEPYESDIVWIFPKTKDKKTEIRDGELYRLSDYGSWWHVGKDDNMGEVSEPALTVWDKFNDYVFPDINSLDRYEHVADIVNSHKDKYIMGVLSISLFPHYWEIRGLTNFFEDLYLESEKMEELLDLIVEKQLESLKIWDAYDIDGIVVGFDDWGLQDNLMISPEKWREYFKPRYKKVWDEIHKMGYDVILHSCGEITSILDDMIEIGLNVINMDQQENMGVERLAREFGGKICFWNPTDIQTVLLNGSDEEIEKYTLNMMKLLGNFNGGFIGKFYTQPKAIGHDPDKSKISFDTFAFKGNIY